MDHPEGPEQQQGGRDVSPDFWIGLIAGVIATFAAIGIGLLVTR